MFGQRRIFIIGASLFCAGSLLAALSWDIPSLIVGEAIIEGIGASLMLPDHVVHHLHHVPGPRARHGVRRLGRDGRRRGRAGPVIGGFLTTNYTWRWAFGINVIVAPLAILGVLLFVRRDEPRRRRISIDVPGACLIAVGCSCSCSR